MSNIKQQTAPLTNSEFGELTALRFVVEALGLDAQKLADELQQQGGSFWSFTALRCSSCAIDPSKANALGLNADTLRNAQSWFESIRRPESSRL